MTRQERIAALEEQLANSRKRRSHLLGSLGKSGSEGDGNGTAAGHVTMQQAFSSESKFKPASPLASDGYTPLAKGIGEGRIERSDLSPSPSHADDGKSRYLSLKRYDLSQVDDKDRPSQLHQEESGGGEASLRAELRQKTKQVSELQSKLAEASKKVEQAGHKALGDKATQMQLASQKGERDRRIELLETSLSEEKRHAEESKKQSAELKFQCEEHEATLRTMRLELHQKTLDFDRIRHQSLRTQSEGEIEAKRMLVQTKDELVAHKAEIVEIKSILYVHQKKEMELKKELQAKEDALEELGQKEQSLTEALRQSKLLNSENSLKLDQTKSEYQIKYDKLEQQKEQGVSEAIRQCKLQIGELQLKMDKAKSEYQLNVDKLEQEIRIHNETNHDLVRKLAEAESDMSEMRSRLNQSQLQLDKDGALIEALELDLSTLAGLDDSLKAAAAAERQRCKDLQEKILHLNQQLVLSDAKQSSQHDRVLVQQKHIETLKQDLQTEQENCSWLRKELHKTNRELLEKNSMINADYLQDTVLTMDATLQATERHMAVVSLLANQRGAELEREKLCCEKLRAELANVHQQLILAKDENRVTEASQITYRMVTSADKDYHRDMLARVRMEAAALRSEIGAYKQAYSDVFQQVQTSQEAMYMEQLSLQRDLVTCMQEIRKNGLNSNSMYHVQAQCSALAAELIDILGSAGLNEQISELVNVVQHHEQMTERFSRVLYASEKSREQLAAKVQTFEFETVSWMDQTKALTAEKQELEASLGKCNRQFKFLQMQNETQSACLESAEAKLKEAHSESLINNEALHTAELRLKQVLADTQTLRNELMIAKKETQHFKEEAARAEEKLNELQNELISFQEQLQGSHEDWVMQTLSVQQQVEPLQRELEATQQDLVPLQQELEDTLRELVEAQQSRDFHAAKMASMKDGMDKMHQTLLRLQPIEMKRVTNPFENDKLDVSEEPHILDHDQTQRLLKQDLDTVTAERDALKIDLEQVTRERDSLQTQVKQEKAQVIKVTMDLDFSEAGEEGSLQRTAFEKDVMNDLAQASGVPTSTFSIKRLSSGSIIVETYVMPNSAGIDPRAIVADLVQQAKDPCSSLRSGKVTSKTVGVAAVQPSSPSRFGHGFASDELEKANSNLTQAKEEVEVKNDEINDLKQQLAYLKQLSQETLAAALQVDQSETISGMNKELAEHTEAWEGQMSTELNKEDSAHYLQPPSTNTSAPQITVASRGVDIAGQESETGGDSQPSIHEFLRKCKHVEELDEALLSRSRQVEELEIKLKEVLDQLETKTKQLEQLNNLNTQNSVELEAIQVQLEELQGQQQDLAQRAVIAELGKKATEKENDNIADLLKNAQQELQFAISARDSTMHSLEAMTSERDGLTMQIEEKDVKILDLSAKWNDSLQQLQVIVAWATSEKAGLQDQLDEACNSLRASQSNCEQRIEAERLRLEKNIENERLRVTELMGKLSIEAAQGQGIQSHVNHLEKVSSDLQNLYQQTGEINAMKKELVDKNACLSELESLVTDQYTAALKQAEILEALLELSGQLDSRVTASQSSFEKMKEDCAKAQLAAAISTRAWQTEQAERVLVFKALLELAGPEMGNAMDVTVQDVDLTVQHVESLLTQIMDDRTMVLGEIQVMAAQLSSAQNEIEQKNGIIEEVESLLSESRNRMEQLEVSLNVSQRRYEEELRASQRMHHDQLEKMMNLLSNEKKNMWESKENEIASLQGAVEESALIAEEIHMVLDESWQKERKAKDEAVSNLEAKIAELAVVGVKLQNEQEKNASLVSEVQLLQKQIAELAAAEGDLGKAHAQEANAASETIKELQEKLALSESQRFLANRDAQDALAASSEHEKEKKLILTTIATNQVAIESLEQTINVLTIDLERKRAETDTLQMEIQRQQEKLVLADKSLSRALFLSAADLKQDAGVDDAYAELSKDASRDFSARVREEKVNAELELARLDSCEKDILGMKEMVEAMQAEKASMERQNQELQERNQEDQKEIARLREDYRSAQGELKKLHQSGTHFSAPVSSEGETVQQLQPQTNDKAMGSESILALEAQVERLEKEGAEMSAECEQLQAALANAQAQRRTAIENAEKAQAEADALRQELYEMRSGAADIVPLGKVEGLEAKVSKLQLFVSELQNKAKEDALNLELLRASEGAATARSKDSENKLVETERAMLACVAEEARLIEEIEAGQNREQELEARLSMLIGIRDPVHVPMPKEHVAKS